MLIQPRVHLEKVSPQGHTSDSCLVCGPPGTRDLFCRAALCPSLYGGMDRCWIFPTQFSGVGFLISFCWSPWDYCLPTSSFEILLNSSSAGQSIEHCPWFSFVVKRKMPLVTNFHLIPTFSAQDFWKFSIKLLISSPSPQFVHK